MAGGRSPVDAVEAVSRRPRPDGCCEWSRLKRPLGRGVAALDVGGRQPPHGQRLHPRVDDDGDTLANRGRGLEEAEWVAGPDLERLHPEVAAADQRHPDEPRSLGPRPEGDRPARETAGQRRRVVDLEPRLRDATRVAERVRHPDLVADVAAQLAHRVAGLEIGQAEPGEDVRAADDDDRQVDEVEQEAEAGRKRSDEQNRRDEKELEPPQHPVSLAIRVELAMRSRRPDLPAGLPAGRLVRRSGGCPRSASRRAARG